MVFNKSSQIKTPTYFIIGQLGDDTFSLSDYVLKRKRGFIPVG